MDDLVEWLRAQLDEDERVAHEAHQPNWCWYTEDKGVVTHVDDDGEWDRYLPANTRSDAEHIALHDPARVLREVEAKRRIMAIHHAREFGYLPQVCDGCGYGGICEDPIVEDINDCPELRFLAAIFVDRPGYRDEWRIDTPTDAT